MKKVILLSALYLAACTVLIAQNQKTSPAPRIPDGTILPVQLSTALSVEKSAQSQVISGRIAQDVLLENGAKLRARTKVLGHVVRVTQGNPSQITITFDKIQISKEKFLTVTTNLRALASYLEVNSATMPIMSPDSGTPWVWWNTQQVGGEDLYGSGPLARGDEIVGHWTTGGAVAKVCATETCRCPIDDSDREQALWVFSTDACGVYGYRNLAIEHAGRTNPLGEITLSFTNRKLTIRAGSGMLLRVNNSPLLGAHLTP